jgi:hypothetical protein
MISVKVYKRGQNQLGSVGYLHQHLPKHHSFKPTFFSELPEICVNHSSSLPYSLCAMPCLSIAMVSYSYLLSSHNLLRAGRPEIIVEAPRPNVIIERPRPVVVEQRPRPVIVEQRPRPVVIEKQGLGGLGGLVAGLGSALGSILTTDTDATQPDVPA